MEFRVAERMMLLNLLSTAEGDVTALRVVREAQAKLGFSDEEREALGFQQDANQVRWNAEADKAVEVDLGKAAQRIIAEKLQGLSAQRKLTLNQLALYERFVEDEDVPTKERDNGENRNERVPNRAQRRAKAR